MVTIDNMNDVKSDSSTGKPIMTPVEASPEIIDRRFHQSYAKAIAEALLENETKGTPSSAPLPSLDDAKDTYTALCYDDPIVGRHEGCTALAFALLSSSFPSWTEDLSTTATTVAGSTPTAGGGYGGRQGGKIISRIRTDVQDDASNRLALSNRLVGGILHATSRPVPLDVRRRGRDLQIADGKDKGEGKEKGKGEGAEVEDGDFRPYLGDTMVRNSGNAVDTARGCGELAYTAFALGPLLCCKDILRKRDKARGNTTTHAHAHAHAHDHANSDGNGDERIRSFLGSYHPPSTELTGGDVASATGSRQRWGEGGDPTDRFLRNMAETTVMEDAGLVLDMDGSAEDDHNTGREKKPHETDHVPPTINDEIFAEDSDPDDYDYGDGDGDGDGENDVSATLDPVPQPPLGDNLQNLIDSFDPRILSQAKDDPSSPPTTRIRSLLKELIYSRFASITPRRWTELKVSSTLSNLTLTLLQLANDHNDGTGAGGDDDGTEALSKEFTRPLLLLRDRALDKTNYDHTNNDTNINTNTNNQTNHHDDDALSEYINLINILLRSNATEVGKFASTDRPGATSINPTNGGLDISPARALGLTSLAGLCTSASSSNDDLPRRRRVKTGRRVRTAVVGSFDYLVDCVEYVRPKKGGADGDVGVEGGRRGVPTWTRVVMAILPVLDFFTGIKSRSDYGRSDSDDDRRSVTKGEGQLLLQTGLFREIILLYTQTQTQTQTQTVSVPDTITPSIVTAQDVVREHLLRAVLVLSAQAPSILGKYAARVPELTSLLYDESFLRHNAVDATLWFALLSSATVAPSSVVATTPMIRPVTTRKGKRGTGTTPVAPPTIEELKNRCVGGTLELCERCVRDLPTPDLPSDGGEAHAACDGADALLEFVRFANCCAHVAVVGEGWIAAVSGRAEDLERVRGCLVRVREGLAGVVPVVSKEDRDAKLE